MSIVRVAPLLTMIACAREATTPAPPPPPLEIAPIASADAAPPAPPPPRPPMRIATAESIVKGYDVDAGSFVAPSGAFAVMRDEDGEQDSLTLSKSVFACAKDPGVVYVKIVLVPRDGGQAELKIADTDAKPAVAECILAQLAHDKTWRHGEPRQLEVILRRR